MSSYALAIVVPAADDVRPTSAESVGARVRHLRETIGLSQMDVAKLCDVDISTVSRWERGRHQHTHRSKARQIRAALEALTWAAELQEEEPMRVLTLAEVQDYIARRRYHRAHD